MISKIKQNTWELAGVIAVLLIQMLAGGILMLPVSSFCSSEPAIVYLSYILGSGLAIIAVCFIRRKTGTCRIAPVPDDIKVKLALAGIFTTYAAAILVSGVRIILDCFTDNAFIIGTNAELGAADWSTPEKALLLISTVIIAPVLEEMTFRGLLLPALWKVTGFHKAAIITSLFFGLLHGTSIVTVASTTLTGLVLAYVFAGTRSLTNCMLIHGTYNYIAVLATLKFSPEAAQLEPVLGEAIASVVPAFIVVIVIITLAARYYMKKVCPGIDFSAAGILKEPGSVR